MSSSSKEPDDIGQPQTSKNVSEETKRPKKPKDKKIKKPGTSIKKKRSKDKKPEKRPKLAAPAQEPEPEKVPSVDSDDEKTPLKKADITPPVPQESEKIPVEIIQPIFRPPTPKDYIVQIADSRQLEAPSGSDISHLETPGCSAALQPVEPPASVPVLRAPDVADVSNVCEVVYASEAETKTEEAPPLAETKEPAPEVKKPE